MERNLKGVLLVVLAVGNSAAADAQSATSRAAMPDSAMMSAMFSRAIERMHPAQFVLDHRAELSLTPEQVPFLESLVLAQADSDRVRGARRVAHIMEQARKPGAIRASGFMEWTGPIDEDAMRKMARDQAEQSIEIQIDMTRDRHAVGAVLTPAQISMLSRIEASEMMGARAGMRGTVTGLIGPTRSAPNSSGSSQPYFEFQVDKPVAIAPGPNVLKYPESLRSTESVGGSVLAQFVVDSSGRYEEGTFKILKTSNSLFTEALRDALPQMHFIPAEVGGVKVRQLVQQMFNFTPGMK